MSNDNPNDKWFRVAVTVQRTYMVRILEADLEDMSQQDLINHVVDTVVDRENGADCTIPHDGVEEIPASSVRLEKACADEVIG